MEAFLATKIAKKMKRKSAPPLQIDHTLFSAYLRVPKHVTQGSIFHDRLTVVGHIKRHSTTAL
jgi:hypothetical protein